MDQGYPVEERSELELHVFNYTLIVLMLLRFLFLFYFISVAVAYIRSGKKRSKETTLSQELTELISKDQSHLDKSTLLMFAFLILDTLCLTAYRAIQEVD